MRPPARSPTSAASSRLPTRPIRCSPPRSSTRSSSTPLPTVSAPGGRPVTTQLIGWDSDELLVDLEPTDVPASPLTPPAVTSLRITAPGLDLAPGESVSVTVDLRLTAAPAFWSNNALTAERSTNRVTAESFADDGRQRLRRRLDRHLGPGHHQAVAQGQRAGLDRRRLRRVASASPPPAWPTPTGSTTRRRTRGSPSLRAASSMPARA